MMELLAALSRGGAVRLSYARKSRPWEVSVVSALAGDLQMEL